MADASPNLAFPVLRAAHKISRSEHTFRYTVTILHPAYKSPGNVLFVFNATDHPTGAIHHETARIACCIIAGNRWDGYFTKEIDGRGVGLELNGLLSKGEYYFYVPEPNLPSPFKYPVVPNFAEWVFPHNNFPSFWAADHPSWPTLSPAASVSSRVTARDQTCRISDAEEACEMAHIIPAQEQAWYDRNGMRRYSGFGHKSLGDVGNMIRLRRDLHYIFDNRKLVFVPKAPSPSDAAYWVAHAMDYSKDLLALYHNLQLHDISGIPREYLLARFAWTIFPDMEGFLINGVERLLITASSDTEFVLASPERCKTFLPQPSKSKSRSQSPIKRARPLEEQEQDIILPSKRMRLESNIPSTLTPPASTLHAAMPTTIDAENATLRKLVSESLHQERHRSDPGGTWLAEQEWMSGQDECRPMSPRTRKRWCLAQGLDLNDDEEEREIGFEFVGSSAARRKYNYSQ